MVINGIPVESVLQFRSKSIVAYQKFHVDGLKFKQSAKFVLNAQKLRKREKYVGEMTNGAKKRLTKAISLLVQSSPEKWIFNPVTKKNQHHKISFITLTLPNVESAKDAKFTHKYLLQPILRIFRSKYKMASYVWKCELQKNESIHYHITTDLFLPWEQLRQHWNAILAKNGLLEAFQEQYGHSNPNSVDIHSVNKINDLEAYLVKYVSKEYQNQKRINGKIWDCSKNLKESAYFTTTCTAELHAAINKEIGLGWLQPVYRDRCVILRSKTTDYYQSFSSKVIDDYYSYLNSIHKWENNEKTTTTTTTQKLAGGYSNTPSIGIRMPSKVSILSKASSMQTLINWGAQVTVFGSNN